LRRDIELKELLTSTKGTRASTVRKSCGAKTMDAVTSSPPADPPLLLLLNKERARGGGGVCILYRELLWSGVFLIHQMLSTADQVQKGVFLIQQFPSLCGR